MSAVADVGEYQVNSGLGVSASCSDTTMPDCWYQTPKAAAQRCEKVSKDVSAALGDVPYPADLK
jgi:hypothetical protein